MKFSDSIDANVELLKELLQGIPAGARRRAAGTANRIEQVVIGIQREYSHDPAAGLGLAFAVMLTAQRMVEMGQDDGSLIKLL
jgi:hypothetical protein